MGYIFGTFFTTWIIVVILCGIPAAYVAGTKNKNPWVWFFLTFLFGPMALLMVGFAPALPPSDEHLELQGLKRCPFCVEPVMAAAVACCHCGHDIVRVAAPAPAQPVRPGTFCRGCGDSLEPGAAFCGNCGRQTA